LSQPLDYYQSMGGKPHPGDAHENYLATDLPTSGEVCKYSVSDGTVCLRFDWAERPRTNVRDFFSGDGGPQTVVRQRLDVDPAKTESADFAGDRFVAIVSITDDYYKPSATAAQASSR